MLTVAHIVFRKHRYFPRVVLDTKALKALHGGDLAVSGSAVDVFSHGLRRTFTHPALNRVSGSGHELSFRTEQDRRKRGKGTVEIDFSLTAGGQTPLLVSGPHEHLLLDVIPYERVVATVRKREAIEKGKKGVRTVITKFAGRAVIGVFAVACVTRFVIHVLAGEQVVMKWDGANLHAGGAARSSVMINATLPDGRRVSHSLEPVGDGSVHMTVDVTGERDIYKKVRLWKTRDGLVLGFDFGESGKWIRPCVFVPDEAPDGQFFVMICGRRYDLCDEVRAEDASTAPAGQGTFGWRFHSVELPSTFTCGRNAERVCEFFAVRYGKTSVIARLTL